MQTIKRLLLIAGCGGVIASAGAAQPFQNGSFENGAFIDNAQHINDLGAGSTAISGWTISAGSNTLSWLRNDNPFTLTTPAGNFFLDLTGPNDSGFASVEQTFSTVAGGIHHLSFDMGANNNCPGFDCTGPMAMKVSVAGTEKTFTGFDPVGPGMQWGTFEMDFTAVGASTTLRLEAVAAAGASAQFRGLDNVVLVVSPVPEPEIYAMLMAGLGLVGWAARRRRRAS